MILTEENDAEEKRKDNMDEYEYDYDDNSDQNNSEENLDERSVNEQKWKRKNY